LYNINKVEEEATERLDAITVRRAIIDQSPPWPVYRLIMVVRRPADEFKRVGLAKSAKVLQQKGELCT
jgi:hypothetical protein